MVTNNLSLVITRYIIEIRLRTVLAKIYFLVIVLGVIGVNRLMKCYVLVVEAKQRHFIGSISYLNMCCLQRVLIHEKITFT